jgi:hypothetical protein
MLRAVESFGGLTSKMMIEPPSTSVNPQKPFSVDLCTSQRGMAPARAARIAQGWLAFAQ